MSPEVSSDQLDILVIENDPAAARLTKEAFKEAGLMDIITTVPNGDEAMAYLRREERYSRASPPRHDLSRFAPAQEIGARSPEGIEVERSFKGLPR